VGGGAIGPSDDRGEQQRWMEPESDEAVEEDEAEDTWRPHERVHTLCQARDRSRRSLVYSIGSLGDYP
jgi:hypothetical protein